MHTWQEVLLASFLILISPHATKKGYLRRHSALLLHEEGRSRKKKKKKKKKKSRPRLGFLCLFRPGTKKKGRPLGMRIWYFGRSTKERKCNSKGNTREIMLPVRFSKSKKTLRQKSFFCFMSRMIIAWPVLFLLHDKTHAMPPPFRCVVPCGQTVRKKKQSSLRVPWDPEQAGGRFHFAVQAMNCD